MTRFKKADVELHAEYMQPAHPAVDVKCRRFPTEDDVLREWPDADRGAAEKAVEYVWDNAVEQFWSYWMDTTGDVENGLYGSEEYAYFPGYNNQLTVHPEGRSSGWLAVHGLPPVEEWDAVMVAHWGRFQKSVIEDLKYRASWESVKDDIEANEYLKPGSTRYNFISSKKGDFSRPDIVADLDGYAREKYGLSISSIFGGR